MNPSKPHFLLFSGAHEAGDHGQWQFSLRTPDGEALLEASDVEPEVRGDRLALLAVVRALESLDQPSRVTMVRCSRYVRQGLEYGLTEWRRNGWLWEAFGQMVPIKNSDLWQRLDQALRFHRVECRYRRFDEGHRPSERRPHDTQRPGYSSPAEPAPRSGLAAGLARRVLRCGAA